MYEWALENGLIDRVPFAHSDVAVYGIAHDLAHISGGKRTFRRPDVMVDEWEKEPAFLTGDQVRVARKSIRAASQRILFDLLVRVGLRSVEARTFPLAYVFDPTRRDDIKPGSLIAVELDPHDMELKFDKPRVVHVPYGLMEDMYSYANFERRGFERQGDTRRELILTSYGQAYSKGSAVKVLGDLGQKVGFPIKPLMLRHSYAVHTLLLLRSNPDCRVEPLIYVRDRLGHRSVQQTMVYLRQIERLASAEALAMVADFDGLYDVSVERLLQQR